MNCHVSPASETFPTGGTFTWLIGRVGGNVSAKVGPRFEFFSASCARKSDRILDMSSFHMLRQVPFGQVAFFTARKSTWETGSILLHVVHGVKVFP